MEGIKCWGVLLRGVGVGLVGTGRGGVKIVGCSCGGAGAGGCCKGPGNAGQPS